MAGKRWVSWLGAILFLGFLFLTSRWIPRDLVDPWGLFKPHKIIQMVGAIVVIQMAGAALVQMFGLRIGMIVSGFLGGLVSSTALTASLSQKSQTIPESEISIESLSYLGATLAMLFQAMILMFIGLNDINPSLFILFIGPIITTLILIFFSSRQLPNIHPNREEGPLIDVFAILKLTIFIAGILALSKWLQNVFGHTGLTILTFLVSLFEIHGSVIANVQLYGAGDIDVRLLGALLTIALLASYISKLVLVASLGHSFLKRRVLLWTCFILLSLGICWFIFDRITILQSVLR